MSSVPVKPKVYLETSFISYLTAKLNPDLTVLQRQLASKRWWESQRGKFDLFVSEAVHGEIRRGDAEAAQDRWSALEGIPLLPRTESILWLATRLIDPGPFPQKAEADAIYIAAATVYGCEYLLTWNFKHINNAQIKREATKIIEQYGYQPTTICTPDELMGSGRD